MSRIGNRVLTIPAGVTVTNENNNLTVKGPKGELKNTFNKLITIEINENKLTCKRANDAKFTKAISDATKLGIEIANAEKEIFRDIEEQSTKARGKVSQNCVYTLRQRRS